MADNIGNFHAEILDIPNHTIPKRPQARARGLSCNHILLLF